MDLFSGKRLRPSQTDGRRANHEMKYDYQKVQTKRFGRAIFSNRVIRNFVLALVKHPNKRVLGIAKTHFGVKVMLD